MKLINWRDGRVIAAQVETAHTLKARLVGLIGRNDLPKGFAFIIPGCRQVHTFLMRFPIDVLYTDAQDKVVCAVEYLKPLRVTRCCRDAARAIELPAGTISANEIVTGDVLAFEDTT